MSEQALVDYCQEADPCPKCGQAPHKPDCPILLRYLSKPPQPVQRRFPQAEEG